MNRVREDERTPLRPAAVKVRHVSVPEGRVENSPTFQPETLGYGRFSLREQERRSAAPTFRKGVFVVPDDVLTLVPAVHAAETMAINIKWTLD